VSGEAVLLPVGGVSSRLDNDSPDYAFSPGLLLTVALAYDSLAGPSVTVDADGVLSPDYRQMQPRLAVSWQEQENGDWLVSLRPGLTSHAGNEWTAEDVAWGFDKAIAQGVMASWRIAGVVGVEKVEVVSRYQARFRLRAPYETFPNWLLSGPPYTVDSAAIRPNATAADPWGLEWLDGHVAGWGPYALTELDSEHLQFEARSDYWAGEPETQSIDVRAVADRRTALALIREDRPVVLLGTDPDETAALLREDDLTVLRTWASHASVEIDFTLPPFDDVRIRHALALATPYDRIRAEGLLGMARPWNGPVKGMSQWYRETPIPYAYEPQDARRLLAEAGYGDGLAADFYLEMQPAAQRIAAIIGRAWKDVGVELTFRDVSGAPEGWLPPLWLRLECGHNLSEPVYDLAHDYAAMNPLLPLPGGPSHVGNWCPRWTKNPAILAQLAELLTTKDRGSRRRQFDQLQDDIITFGSSIFLAEMQQVTVANRKVPKSLLAPDSRLYQATNYQNPKAEYYLPARPPTNEDEASA
jgi:ABC-type transport system substrate-binding protein